MTALSVGLSAAYRSFLSPQSSQDNFTREQRIDLYAQGWAYYHNKMFSRRDQTNWTGYLTSRELYKHTRLIYNPVTAIVDFYVDNIWQPKVNPINFALVLPVSDNTEEETINALAQLDQWTNWSSEAQKIKTYAGATGNCLVEIIDDLTRQKITQQTHWAGNVTDLELNYSGDVQQFTLEYDVADEKRKKLTAIKRLSRKKRFHIFAMTNRLFPKANVPPSKITRMVFAPPFGSDTRMPEQLTACPPA